MAVSLNVSKMEVYSTLDAMKEKATHKINRFSETAPIHIKDAVHAFADVAELTGCNAIASKMLGFNITNALRQEVEGNIMAGLMSLVIVGVVLMVISINFNFTGFSVKIYRNSEFSYYFFYRFTGSSNNINYFIRLYFKTNRFR